MFDKNNKKQEKKAEKEINKEDEAVKELNERIEKEVQIHSMPQKFKQEKKKAHESKTVGMIIVIGGAVFMIAVSVAMYYYLFVMPSKPKVTPKNEVAQETETNVKTSTETTQKLVETPIAEETKEPAQEASTSVEVAKEATSTEEVKVIGPEEELGNMQDTDGDGLTNLEEELLGSDINAKDTDGDGYDDLSEVLNLYDPISPRKLKDNPNIKTSNSNVEYEVLYPASWAENYFDDSLILNSSDGYVINIGVQPNEDFMSAEDWYSKFVDDSEISEDQRVSTDTWDGIRSDSGFQLYLTDKERRYIIVISYTSTAGDDDSAYKNIYEMMVNSFVVR